MWEKSFGGGRYKVAVGVAVVGALFAATGCLAHSRRSSSSRRYGAYRPAGGPSVQSVRRGAAMSPAPTVASSDSSASRRPMAPMAPGASPSVARKTVAAERPAVADNGATGSGAAVVERQAAQPIRRLVVYTGTVRVQVVEPEKAADTVRHLAEAMGGYVQTSLSTQVVVRIPARKFFIFIKALGKKVGEVFDKQIRSQDITEQYLDLKIRLKAQLAVFARLQELLKKAQNVREAMIVQRELSRLVEQIERLKGRIRYLEKAASLSTITVFLVRPTVRHRIIAPPPLRSPFRWIRKLGISSLLRCLRR